MSSETATSRRVSRSVWLKIRKDYEEGKGSCRELGEKYGINPWAVSTRCKRERRRDGHIKLEQKLVKCFDQSLDKKAQSMAERAALFVQRSVDEADRWLDQIDRAKRLLDQKDLPGLRDLIGSWRSVIETTRKAYRLDEVPPNRSQLDLLALSAPIVMHVVEVDAQSSVPLALAEGATSPHGDEEPG